MRYIFEQRLQDAPFVKPILSGGELKSMFNISQSGPFMRDALDGLVRWEFDHEHASMEEAKEWLYTQKERFHIP